jgi:protein-L-isoaspartate O-methyltransferase
MAADPEPRALIDALADLLTGHGWLTDPRWRAAMRAVPRHLFVPSSGWATPDSEDAAGYRIDRESDPAVWWETVYSDASIVTQVNDGDGDPSAGTGRFTSSVSAPGVVMMFGELLGTRDSDRVLEIGTGSGWTASMLAHLVGERGRVVSIEVDADLSARASANIKAARLTNAPEVELIVADASTLDPGELGGPFDRLHATCGVDTVPWSWVEALRPGGVGVAPWCPPYGIGNRLRFTRTADDEAVGALHGSAGYMMLRSQRPEPGRLADFLHHWDDRRVTTTAIDPRSVVRDGAEDWRTYGGDVAVSAMVPGVRYDLCHAEDGSGEATLWLRETRPGTRESGSWALAEYLPAAATFEVHAYGPRDLWAEVSAAWLRWCGWGRPIRNRFGMTITPGGRRIWLDRPDGVIH